MFALKGEALFEQDIKKSVFRAVAGPVADEASARAFIAAHSVSDANHNCWAYRIGQIYRFNDDGEPGGTAGKPILQAIDGQELDCVAVLVSRWFGGVLLGSGGLVRAYGGTAAGCLRQAEKREIVAMVSAGIAVGFADLAAVKARLAALGARIADETYLEDGARFSVDLPEAAATAILAAVTDMTSGRARISTTD
jgi:uncharacterized YigZ family protein